MSHVAPAEYASEEEVRAGIALFRPLFFLVYDPIVWWFGGLIAWRCSLQRLVRFTEKHLSGRHLDIGVGNGRLLSECKFPVASPELTMLDLSPVSLEYAARRLSRYQPRTIRGNCLEPFDLPPNSVDSISLIHMMHCLPGAIRDKGIVFDNCLKVLAPDGVVFGCIILYGGVDQTFLSRSLIRLYNVGKWMTNLQDDVEGLEAALARRFTNYSVEVVGSVALFVARP